MKNDALIRPVRSLEEARDDLRTQLRQLMPIKNAISILRHIEVIEAEIARRKARESEYHGNV